MKSMLRLDLRTNSFAVVVDAEYFFTLSGVLITYAPLTTSNEPNPPNAILITVFPGSSFQKGEINPQPSSLLFFSDFFRTIAGAYHFYTWREPVGTLLIYNNYVVCSPFLCTPIGEPL